MVILEDIAEFFKKLFSSLFVFIKLFKLNYRIYTVNKQKNKAFKELGIIVYEFYNVDKTLLGDEEVESLINEIKDFEIEIDEMEKQIEMIKNPIVEEKEEISNELLLDTKKEIENDEENKESNGTSETSK